MKTPTNTATAKPIISARRSFGWDWASRLPRAGVAADGIYSALRAGYLALPARADLAKMCARETTAADFDARVERMVEDQTSAWGSVRAFARLTSAQVRALMAATAIKEVADLESDAMRAIDAATGA